MTSVADLLDLWPSEDVAAGLHEKPEVVRRWRRARAVPESRARDLVEFAILRGHLGEVARIAAEAGPHYSEVAAMLGDLRTKTGSSIVEILDEARPHHLPDVDAIARVRAAREEWDGRDDLADRIRSGGRI